LNGLHPTFPNPSRRSLRGLDSLNFFLADVQTGVGPFLAIYLAGHRWNEEWVGIAMTVGGIAGIACQTPAGALVDRLHSKRALVLAGVVALAVGTLLLLMWPTLASVMAAQTIIGGVSSVFGPAIAAISLGLVGPGRFDKRTGRNQTLKSAGNVITAVLVGVLAYCLSNRSIFFVVLGFCVPTILSLLLINPGEIDYNLARGGGHNGEQGGETTRQPARVLDLLGNKPLMLFCVSSVMFHFANAAILPLLGERLANGKGKSSALFMSACVVTTQLTIVLISVLVVKLAALWGRKPVLLLGFAVLPIRAVLYTLVHGTLGLVAIQVLDGIGAGIFGVLSVLVVADLTRGSGRFNLAQGALATAVGIGASLSQTVAGLIAHHFSYDAAFLFLAGIAAAALAILWLFMPETRSWSAVTPKESLSDRARMCHGAVHDDFA